jgi:glycosyltransferase involved in cell wall biosynthesis
LTSIVVPTLNEDFSITYDRLRTSLTSLDGTFEILFVDDSSEEHRSRAREGLTATDPRVAVRVLEGPRTGKGAAVRLGVSQARGSVIFTVDADLPVPLEHIGQFLGILEQGADVVIAERPLDRAFDSAVRYVTSRGLLVLQRAVVFHSAEFKDTQCGFKAFRGDLARSIAQHQIVDGGMYDLEYLFDAWRAGSRIVRVPIVPNPETRASRINIWRCIRRDWIDLVRIRLKQRAGNAAL